MASPPEQHAHVEDQAQLFLDADRDSALGEEQHDALSTSSLRSSIFQYRQEHGRTYSSYGERGKYSWSHGQADADHVTDYVLPNDEQELDRLGQYNRLLLSPAELKKKVSCSEFSTLVLGRVAGQLNLASPLASARTDTLDNFANALQADEHPEAVVTGIDVSPVQPVFVPPNVWFEVSDVEQPWTFSYKFDLIFSRMMTGAISDWRKFVQQSFELTAPFSSRCLEVQDISFHLRSNDGSLPEGSALAQWAGYMLQASIVLGAPLDSVESVRDIMIDVGFEDVQQKAYVWPMNSWPKAPHLKRLGTWTFYDFTSSLTGISVALFTRGLGWSATELEAFLVDVRKDMQKTSIHAFWPMYVRCHHLNMNC
ncbi:hypothetical protein PV08_08697 [Exophiala spinifera]|uniref:Methyltransferase type 11 domain-containing protein n=1 Tax=Exophiala spinifera TaxID=91928 RepID=A0A0D2BQV0_9EURO|nr:uncharacterized protein PV08_08697 [Exophiala spinifera]KIW13509.1 hypothetical protein PV08_08697 [Exophiala spinifera]